MATTIDLYDQSTSRVALRLRLDRIYGEGRVQPRLMFLFMAQTTESDQLAEITRLRLKVSSGNEYLGTGSPQSLVTKVWGGGEDQLLVEVPIGRAVVEFIDQHSEPQVQVRLEVQAVFRIGAKRQPDTSQEPPGHEVETGGMQTHEIPLTEWVRQVVQPLGVEQFVFLEVAIPPAPERERWQQALVHLNEAEQRYLTGDDPGVLQRCYAAFEALEGAPKKIFDGLGDDPKRKHLDDALDAAKAYMHSGRHVSKAGVWEGLYPVDHRDAAFALGQAKVWLSYISRLLQRP